MKDKLQRFVRLGIDGKTWWRKIGLWWIPVFATIRNRKRKNAQLICNKEFVYENFCSLPHGHDGPCDNPPNAEADRS